MLKRFGLYWYFAFSLAAFNGLAQNTLQLELMLRGAPEHFDIHAYRMPAEVHDVREALDTLRNLISNLQAKGMLEAGVDQLETDTASVRTVIHIGPVYQWGKIDFSGIPGEYLPGGFSDVSSGKPLSPIRLAKLFDHILGNMENDGYPFAQITLQSPVIEGNAISAKPVLKWNDLFVYDSIYLSGTSGLSTLFLEKYLHIQKGQPYSEREVRKIDARLARLPFIKLLAPSRIYFGRGKVRIQIQIDARPSDRIDGVLGFAPNSAQNQSNLLLSGEFNLDIKNLFNRGMGFTANWRSFLRTSQELTLHLHYPYIFNTDVGLDGSFNMVKLDTTFVRLKSSAGARILLGGLDFIRIYYESQQTTLLSADTLAVRLNQRLPLNNPVSVHNYGMEVHLNRLDYPLNPKKGFTFRGRLSLGSRHILRHPEIEAILFPDEAGRLISVYDRTDLRSTQFSLGYHADMYIPLRKQTVLRLLSEGDQLAASQILRNDLFRFGGTRSLRGFDENALEGSSVHMLHLELRYLLSREANFHLFANAAYYENNVSANTGLYSDLPFGFGAGINVPVGNGVLQMDYALGSEKGNPIQFNQAKIHFAIINYL